jgi:DNA-binding NarL/FixJ family response regulator
VKSTGDAESADDVIRIAVFGEYPSVRAGLRALLAGQPGIEVVAELSRDRLDVGWRDSVTVAVMDLSEATAEGRSRPRFADEPYSVVAIVDTPADGVALLRLANPPLAVLLRDADGDQLAAAVRSAASGLVTMAPAISRAVFQSDDDANADARPTTLTRREQEVIELMSLGLPNKAIALRLGISENTAKFHVGTILGKLNAASRTEAVMAAARLGWLPI